MAIIALKSDGTGEGPLTNILLDGEEIDITFAKSIEIISVAGDRGKLIITFLNYESTELTLDVEHAESITSKNIKGKLNKVCVTYILSSLQATLILK